MCQENLGKSTLANLALNNELTKLSASFILRPGLVRNRISRSV
jgi:hypothetical protein